MCLKKCSPFSFNSNGGNQSSLPWKAHTILCEAQMKELGFTLSHLFEEFNHFKSSPHAANFPKVSISDIFNKIEEDVTNGKSEYKNIVHLLHFMKIDLNLLKNVLTSKYFTEKEPNKMFITIETFIMAVKLIDYGNSIFLNLKRVISGDALKEEKLLEWLEVVSSMDTVCGEYESKELLQYRRFIAVQDLVNDELFKQEFTDSNQGEVLYTHALWNSTVVPKCLYNFYLSWEAEIDELLNA